MRYTERHLHLSGAVNYQTLWELVIESGMKIRSKDFFEFKNSLLMKDNATDLNSYLKILHFLDLAQSSPDAIYKSMYNACVESYINGCDNLLIRWNIYKRSKDFQIDFDRLLYSANTAIDKAKSIYGLNTKQILCLGTDLSDIANAAILKKAIQFKDKNVYGIDVAGPQASRNKMIGMDLLEHFNKARDAGLFITMHCGEVPTENEESELEYVLNILKPNSIGHGVQMYKYPRLLEIASKQGTEFEICISSNLATKSLKYEDFKSVFKMFNEYEIKYSINTDSTFPLCTNIKKENDLYSRIIRESGLINKAMK